MHKRIVTTFFLSTIVLFSFAQHINLSNNRVFLYEKAYLKEKNPHLSIKPLFFKNSYQLTDSLFADSLHLASLFHEPILLKKNENSYIKINPIIFSYNNISLNEKSMQIDGGVGLSLIANKNNRWYSDIAIYGFSTNYNNVLSNEIDSFGIIPHYGTSYFKRGNRYYSYEADIRLTFRPAEYISFDAGKSRHFFGMGQSSLFLSDISNSMPFVSTNVDVWKLKYRWMILLAKDYNLSFPEMSSGLKTKYIAFHYLSVNLSKRINLNFFESIVTNPYDQQGQKGLDMHYLNPVIFYRPVEFAAGTYDNALFGLGLNIRLFKQFWLFSQILIDDMIISEVKAGNGWWGNKYGGQFGAKGYDFLGLENLFVSGEINLTRPYTYTHARDNISYSNHRLPLAHSAGANFAQAVFFASYSKNRFLYSFQMQILVVGQDSSEVSYGSDIMKSYDMRLDSYGNTYLQGDKAGNFMADANVSFLINPHTDMSIKAGGKYASSITAGEHKHDFQLYLSLSSSVFHSEK